VWSPVDPSRRSPRLALAAAVSLVLLASCSRSTGVAGGNGDGGGAAAPTPGFTYLPAGALAPGSGSGRVDAAVWLPELRFPLEQGPAYCNSQVWGRGGLNGPPGSSQCDAENYDFPWRDNFCEDRAWGNALCPAGRGHQGQDIRPASCAAKEHWAVAVADGTVMRVGSYSVWLIDEDHNQHRYLHLDPESLVVAAGDAVVSGDRIGLVSDHFVDDQGRPVPTTVHLHYDVKVSVEGVGFSYVPPYGSLVRAYESLVGTSGEQL
jgi:murein DD-endopeptidase MepM/ murein hydrolase activator NlpD